MIKEALEYLVGLPKLDEIQLLKKRLVDTRYKTIADNDDTSRRLFVTQDGIPLRLGTVAALCELVNRFHEFSDLTKDTKVRVTVDSNSVIALFQPDEPFFVDLEARKQIEAVYVPLQLQDDDLHFDDLSKFVEFLDQHEGQITDEDLIRSVTKFLKVTDLREAKMEDRGAYVEVVTAESTKVETNGIKIPKTLTIRMVSGTREYLVKQTFLLRMRLRPSPAFDLIKKSDDGSWEELLQMIMADLTSNLDKKNVLILEGASA